MMQSEVRKPNVQSVSKKMQFSLPVSERRLLLVLGDCLLLTSIILVAFFLQSFL